MILLSNIHIIILLCITIFFVRHKFKDTNIILISLVLFSYAFSDTFRFLSKSYPITLFFLILKDTLLLILFILNINLILDFFKNLKKFEIFIFVLLITFLLINFLINDEKILFFPGLYDILFFPILLIILFKIKIDLKLLYGVFELISLFVIVLFFIQLFFKDLYINLLLNNFSEENIKFLFSEKSWYPDLNNHYVKHINLFSSLFNNPGRLNHFVPSLFLIMYFFYLININKERALAYSFLLLVIVIINSSRFSLLLILLPLSSIFIFNLHNNRQLKKFSILVLALLTLYGAGYNYFYKLHHNKIDRKNSINTGLIILYHNFYEPIISSFDNKRSQTPSSVSGRFKIIERQFDEYFLTRNEFLNLKSYLFGNGIGKHSMSLKILQSDKKYIYENNFIVLLFEYGLFLIVLMMCSYIIFIKKIISLNNNSNIKIKFLFRIISLYPLILFFTGYQFYRDYAFQFYYFFLIGLVINYFNSVQNNHEN